MAHDAAARAGRDRWPTAWRICLAGLLLSGAGLLAAGAIALQAASELGACSAPTPLCLMAAETGSLYAYAGAVLLLASIPGFWGAVVMLGHKGGLWPAAAVRAVAFLGIPLPAVAGGLLALSLDEEVATGALACTVAAAVPIILLLVVALMKPREGPAGAVPADGAAATANSP